MGTKSAPVQNISIPEPTYSQSLKRLDLISGRTIQDTDVMVTLFHKI